MRLLVMLFKYELNVLWQYVTIDNEIREAFKRVKKKKKTINIILIYIALFVLLLLSLLLLFLLLLLLLLVSYFVSKLFFFLKNTILSHLHAFDPRILIKRWYFHRSAKSDIALLNFGDWRHGDGFYCFLLLI